MHAFESVVCTAAIADAAHRFNQILGRRSCKRFSQAKHVHINRSFIDVRTDAPYLIDELSA